VTIFNVGFIYGTRPEAIKIAPIVRTLNGNPSFNVSMIETGQHVEMLEGILAIWNLSADVNLSVRDKLGVNADLGGYILQIKNYLKNKHYDLILVQGDTTSATAGCIAAYELGIPVAHIEAGLRSGDLMNPWPEEGNRRIIDSLSSIHLAPTAIAERFLIQEGHGRTTHLTGNTIVDALRFAAKVADSQPLIQIQLESELGFSLKEKYVLLTQHRREAFGVGQIQVFAAVKRLAEIGQRVVFPVHLNPKVKNLAVEYFEDVPNVILIKPQGYLHFLQLLKNCNYIISDSGGLQEEAPSFGKSIVITRKTTERPEVLESGFGQLVGFDEGLIFETSIKFSSGNRLPENNPFGDGSASEKIISAATMFLAG
jgi:UDP-N-acetylglucosamine 2-epimerase (non-hydrolysing)